MELSLQTYLVRKRFGIQPSLHDEGVCSTDLLPGTLSCSPVSDRFASEKEETTLGGRLFPLGFVLTADLVGTADL